MKKVAFYISLCAIMAVVVASCQKEEQSDVTYSKNIFKAYIEQNDNKTYLDGSNIKWREGDEILITNGINAQTYTAINLRNDGGYAEFVCPEGNDIEGEHFYATYPATTCTRTSVTLSHLQSYDANNKIVGFPMYAESSSENSHVLQFRNLCSVLKLTLQQNGKVVKRINITTNSPISGTFSLSEANDGYQCASTDNAATAGKSNSVTLDCGETGVSINDTKDFYIYIPEGEYSQFSITIETADGATCRLQSNRTINFRRSHVLTLSRVNNDITFRKNPPQSIKGLYSVADNQRVYIAQGNLYYYPNGGTRKWKFYDEQYGYEHSATSTKNDTICHFIYGYNTLASNNANSCISYNSTSGAASQTNYQDYLGIAAIQNSVAGTNNPDWHWRTMSIFEWYYLLEQRTMWYPTTPRMTLTELVIGSQHIKGMMLYPDDYPDNDRVNYPITGTTALSLGEHASRQGVTVANWGNDMAPYQTTQETFTKMQQNGCVFLPAAGSRYNSTIQYCNQADGTCVTQGTNQTQGLYMTCTREENTLNINTLPSGWESYYMRGVVFPAKQHFVGWILIDEGCTIRGVWNEEFGEPSTNN